MTDRRPALLSLLLLCAAVLAIGPIGAAQACDAENQHSFGVSAGCFDLQVAAPPAVTNLAPDFTQAGGHPFETTMSVRFNAPAEADPVFGPHWPPESARDVLIGLPPGLLANPSAVATCARAQLASRDDGDSLEAAPGCPPASQIGVVTAEVNLFEEVRSLEGIPLYNLTAAPGSPANFGFTVLGLPVVAGVRAGFGSGGGGRLSLEISDLTQTLAMLGVSIDLWGVPADPAHTPMRSCPGEQSTGFGGPTCAAGVAPRAFVTMPSACTGPTEASLSVDSWSHPGVFRTTNLLSHRAPGLRGDPTDLGSYPVPYPGFDSAQWGGPQGTTGCDLPPFKPSLAVEPSSHSANSPTGLDIDLTLPQEGLEEPGAIAESDLASTSIALASGLAINPAVANGLSGCTAAQIDLGSSDAPSCLDSSKLGAVKLKSPLLGKALSGPIYAAVGAEGADGSTLPVYLVAENDGTSIKLAGKVSVDRASGRLSAGFQDIPQIPFSDIQMSFFPGQRAPFVTPPACGTYVSQGHFVPWSRNETVTASSSFAIASAADGGPCKSKAGEPFAPKFTAGSSSPVAGDPTSFRLKVSRTAGEQELSSLRVSLPPGMTAVSRGIPACSEASLAAAAAPSRSAAVEIASPSCPASSQVGTVTAAVGAGTEPFYLSGSKLYLAQAPPGSPPRLAAIVPVRAGPFDLGTTVLRFSLSANSRSGRIDLAADLPSAQENAVLRLQSIAVDIARRGFIRNPTNCRPAAVAGRIGGDGGGVAKVSTRFQMLDCAALGFKPSLRMRFLGGRSATRHSAHPGLRAVVKGREGDTAVKKMAVTLPPSEQLDPAHIRGVCRVPDLAAGKCPAASRYGSIAAVSPLFKGKLKGPIYLVASEHKFPDLVASLHGALDVDLRGRLAFEDGLVRLVFDSLPELPSAKIALTMRGGRHGLFVNNRNLCLAPSLAAIDLGGQNGKRFARHDIEAGVSCGK